MNFLHRLNEFFRELIGINPRYKAIFIEDPPDQVLDGVIYLIGENSNPWSASFICPCGCKELISLSLIKADHPSWRASYRRDGSDITIHPSVWRTKGCRSHFFIRKGRVVWAMDDSHK
jgi:hypothetical protein